RRELAALKRELTDRAAALGATGQARALLAEAAAVGLIGELPPQSISETDALVRLREGVLTEVSSAQAAANEGDQLMLLSAQRSALRTRLSALTVQLTHLRRAVSENSDFVSEMSEQRARLSSLGLFAEDPDTDHCAFCGQPSNGDSPWNELREELQRLDGE